MTINIPDSHPRASSLKRREILIEACQQQVVAHAGLIAHGRGEAFDYLIGEKTPGVSLAAIKVAVAKLITAKWPVLSVNGNVAALCPGEIVQLAEITGSRIEVNLFYRTTEREQAIKKVLEEAGAKEILGVNHEQTRQILELQSERRIVDINGIYKADVVLVPLEDGDRTESLVKMGKYVIAIDLNPLSRTSRRANLTIVDDVERALEVMYLWAREYRNQDPKILENMCNSFNNNKNLEEVLNFMSTRLTELAGEYKLV